jgi:hypothetical protein
VGLPHVVQVDAQQLATAESRQHDLRSYGRIRQSKPGKRFLELFTSTHARVPSLTQEPGDVVRVLLEGCCKQWAPGRNREGIRKKTRIALEFLEAARLFLAETLEKQSRAFFVRQISNQRFDFWIDCLHADILRHHESGVFES